MIRSAAISAPFPAVLFSLMLPEEYNHVQYYMQLSKKKNFTYLDLSHSISLLRRLVFYLLCFLSCNLRSIITRSTTDIPCVDAQTSVTITVDPTSFVM